MVTLKCPVCGLENIRGNFCSECGSALNTEDVDVNNHETENSTDGEPSTPTKTLPFAVLIPLFILAVALVLILNSSDKTDTQTDTSTTVNSTTYAVSLIQKGRYSEATVELISERDNDKTAKVLYNYACAREEEAKNDFDMVEHYLDQIDLTYSGPLAQEILAYKAGLPERKGKMLQTLIANNPPPLKLVKTMITFNAIDNPEARVVVQNISKKTIDAYTIGFYCFDRYDNPVNHYVDDTNRYGGLSQHTIKPGKTFGYNWYWTLFGHENTAKIKAVLENVHFTDGTIWEPLENQEVSIRGASSK